MSSDPPKINPGIKYLPDIAKVWIAERHIAKPEPREAQFLGSPRQTLLIAHRRLIALEGLNKAGRNLTRESVLKAIESIKDWDPGWGLKYSYGGDNRRVMSRVGRLVVVKDGKWTKKSEWIELQEGGRK